jgi:hypothetical protein
LDLSVFSLLKVGLVLSLYGFLRKSELWAFNFKDVQDQADCMVCSVTRKKQNCAPVVSKFCISGKVGLAIMRKYIALFTEEEKMKKDGRFLR